MGIINNLSWIEFAVALWVVGAVASTFVLYSLTKRTKSEDELHDCE